MRLDASDSVGDDLDLGIGGIESSVDSFLDLGASEAGEEAAGESGAIELADGGLDPAQELGFPIGIRGGVGRGPWRWRLRLGR